MVQADGRRAAHAVQHGGIAGRKLQLSQPLTGRRVVGVDLDGGAGNGAERVSERNRKGLTDGCRTRTRTRSRGRKREKV